jgi:hypothetical protein
MTKTEAARAFVEALKAFDRAEGEELAEAMAEALAAMVEPKAKPKAK